MREIVRKFPDWCNEILQDTGLGTTERFLTLDRSIQRYRLPKDVELVDRLFINGVDYTLLRVTPSEIILQDS